MLRFLWRARFPFPLVPKLQLGNVIHQAPAWRVASNPKSRAAKLELQGLAFPSWSLGTRAGR